MLKPFHTSGLSGWPFNDLERLLQQAAGNGGQGVADGKAHTAFWNALLTGDLHILGSVDDSGRASLPSYGFPGGDALVAFTSRELLQHSIAEELSCITTPARAFFEMTAGARIALNPCGPYGKEFTPEEIAGGLGGVVMTGANRFKAARDAQVLLGHLAAEPTELIDAITAICRTDQTISAVYLCAVAIPSTGEPRPHPLIGLDAENYAAARDAVGAAADRWSKGAALPVDIVDMHDGGTLSTHLRSSGRVLYRRKQGWLAGLRG
ncbi:MAG TPA: enhanced serine sensitivity protein SseB C-terminal domain-containing protein [Phycisphaerales bacterium]|nr:enhanced serine sensitivity protein SseB C-terminal domain-containing protein [Phycisphaerales bacterium]